MNPWKRKCWVIPPTKSGAFVAAMEQVLDVYKRPYDLNFPVVNMDESPGQLIGETKLPIPSKPGQVARYEYEYVRKGVYNVFLACEALVGKRHIKITTNKSPKEWAEVLQDNVLTTPLLDRILYRCEIIKLSGKSYRMENRKTIFGKNILLT